MISGKVQNRKFRQNTPNTKIMKALFLDQRREREIEREREDKNECQVDL